jgi:5-methyltetrahydropteroyltriglutamate--homocysteine methyltransferase
MMTMLTTVIGSYPLKYDELGRDAILQSVDDQVRAGVDLVSDGQTRYDMIEYFARAIDGYSFDGASAIVDKIGRGHADMFVEDFRVAKDVYPRVKGIVTGPVTLVFSSRIKAQYGGYRDENVYLDTADALLDIATALEAEGAEWIQIDEPFLSVGAPMDIAQMAVEHIARGIRVPVALHVCGTVGGILPHLVGWSGVTLLSHGFMGDKNDDVLESEDLKSSDKMLGLGCVDTKSPAIESKEAVVALIEKAAQRLTADRIVVHPDCGLRMMPHEAAFKKLEVMVAAARECDTI